MHFFSADTLRTLGHLNSETYRFTVVLLLLDRVTWSYILVISPYPAVLLTLVWEKLFYHKNYCIHFPGSKTQKWCFHKFWVCKHVKFFEQIVIKLIINLSSKTHIKVFTQISQIKGVIYSAVIHFLPIFWKMDVKFFFKFCLYITILVPDCRRYQYFIDFLKASSLSWWNWVSPRKL